MTDGANKPGLTGEILGKDEQWKGRPAMDLPLQMPPGVSGMSLGQALLGQIPYWGVKRSLDAYRKAVESGVQALEVVARYHEAKRHVEMEKARWENRETYRGAAALQLVSDLLHDASTTARHAG